MPLIQVKVMDGVYTAQQKQAIVERLSDAMVEIAGEDMRRLTWCVVEEVASGEWGIGGGGRCSASERGCSPVGL